MRRFLWAIAGLASCQQTPPPSPSLTPQTVDSPPPAVQSADSRDEIVAFFDLRPIRVSDVGRHLIEQDFFSTVDRYIAYLLLEDLRRSSGLTNDPSELEARAQWEIRRGRDRWGLQWASFLRRSGHESEQQLAIQLAASRRLHEMLLNEKIFFRDVCRGGYVTVRLEYFEPTAQEPAETIEQLIISPASPAPFLTPAAQEELLGAQPGQRLELPAAVGRGRYVVEVLERRPPIDPSPAELTRMVLEHPPEAHELGLWIAHRLQEAQRAGRIQYADRNPQGN